MPTAESSIRLELRLASPDMSPERGEMLGADLYQELSKLPVEQLVYAEAPRTPRGSKSVDPVTAGTLIITLLNSRPIVEGFFRTVQMWVSQLDAPDLVVKLGDDELRISGRKPTRRQAELIRLFIDQHAKSES